MAEESDAAQNEQYIELTAAVIAAYVSKNVIPTSDLPSLISQTYSSLSALKSPKSTEQSPELQKPAVSVKKSITQDHLVCLEDGKQFKSLKRHLMTDHGMNPEEYRTKWNLPSDYPMVAPTYSAIRSEMAKQMGLGRKPGKAPPRKSRRKKAA